MKYTVNEPCACGCGFIIEVVSKAVYYRLKTHGKKPYVNGHQAKGARNVNWNNNTSSHNGYRTLFKPDHPNASTAGWILEHRFVMSEHLGRPLHRSEIVHHKNENKLDNRIDNLEITTTRDHYFMHDPNKYKRVIPIPKNCVACGKEYVQKIISNHKRSKFCSKECRNAAGDSHPRRKFSKELRDSVRASTLSRTETAKVHGLTNAEVKSLRTGCKRV